MYGQTVVYLVKHSMTLYVDINIFDALAALR